MNSYDIADRLVTALRADTTFTNYCTSALGTIPAFYVGFDADNPPKEVKLPFVALVPNTENNVDNQYFEHQINMGAAVSKDTVTTSTATNTVKFTGYDTALDFGRKLLEGVQRYVATEEDKDVSASTTISLIGWTPARIAHYYPEFHVTRELTFTTQFE